MEEGITDSGWKFQYQGNWYGKTGDFSKYSEAERKEIFAKKKAWHIKKIEDLKINSTNSKVR